MDDREFFCKRHRAEFPTFMKVLGAMPVDQFTYRPHERSPIRRLIWYGHWPTRWLPVPP